MANEYFDEAKNDQNTNNSTNDSQQTRSDYRNTAQPYNQQSSQFAAPTQPLRPVTPAQYAQSQPTQPIPPVQYGQNNGQGYASQPTTPIAQGNYRSAQEQPTAQFPYAQQPQQSQQQAQAGVYGAPQTPQTAQAAQNAQHAQNANQYRNPGAPMYGQNAQNSREKNGNAFADPANAFGTEASVTAAGVNANAHTVESLIKKNRTTTIWTSIGAAAAAAVLVAGLGFAGIRSGILTIPSSSSLSSITSSTGGSGSASATSSSSDWSAVAKAVSASVVSIQGTVSGGTVIGSGAILNTDGDIVTNNHVVSGASNLQVTLSDGAMYEAEVVGTDPTTDLAVIKLQNPPSNLTPVTFADSDDLAVGESVMAIGSPLGYENTATTGIVSALNRPVSVSSEDNSGDVVVTNAVQIDASINSGNSGGPTFNTDGKLIGINSSIATTSSSSSSEGSSGSIGIGFAIPANLVKWVTSSIIENGSATHVSLGVTVKSATATADGVTVSGSQVQSVVSGSAAADAGVQQGDTIVAYNKHSVGSNAALLGYVRATQKGEQVTLTIIRDGKALDLTVNMDKEESTTTSSSNSNSQSNNDSNSQNNNNGNSSNNPFEQFFGGSGSN
ncbi:S1C family serine protease [Alloscardovia criceti]|uniref:S1C family serine protease n=1 Tax=Alloscardovia criceti TaxID=356828 RepID=UPI00037F6078|nr:trypsin-like peptidase domain-containing protein [Alloscardovia criceti]